MSQSCHYGALAENVMYINKELEFLRSLWIFKPTSSLAVVQTLTRSQREVLRKAKIELKYFEFKNAMWITPFSDKQQTYCTQ